MQPLQHLAGIVVRPFFCLLVAGIMGAAAPAAKADDAAWGRVTTPAAGPAQVIGKTNRGCVAGAVALPALGPGWQVVRLERSRFWGHPDLLRTIRDATTLLQRGRRPMILIGDMAQARGGPMPSGHASHQTGIDADIMFTTVQRPLDPSLREAWQPQSTLSPDGRQVDLSRFGPDQVTMLKSFAIQPGVDRIFVNFVLKRHLCQTVQGDRTWLRRIRPWVGHDGHFHVRLRCPAGQPLCTPQDAIPPGDGCDASLDAWFLPPPPRRPGPPAAKPPPPPMPTACEAVLAAP
ncbi:penicillin-insensitive murein endopeptidase [Zavarzinia sp. CC-PAN008]|uniref:penicillin-insensitive murein endopeptidase n=1 Tax=Zavarzinia sp. CC-PAN008 TaxID=3243332 RepID=UPI003F74912B